MCFCITSLFNLIPLAKSQIHALLMLSCRCCYVSKFMCLLNSLLHSNTQGMNRNSIRECFHSFLNGFSFHYFTALASDASVWEKFNLHTAQKWEPNSIFICLPSGMVFAPFESEKVNFCLSKSFWCFIEDDWRDFWLISILLLRF